MKLVKSLFLVFVIAAFTACGSDKKSGGGDGDDALSVTVQIEVPATITDKNVKVTGSDSKQDSKSNKAGEEVSCEVEMDETSFDYVVDGDKLKVNENGVEDTFTRVSGNSGELKGEWNLGEDAKSKFTVTGYMTVKDSSLVIKAVCKKK